MWTDAQVWQALPHDLAGTATIARYLAQELSPDTYINVMGQYRPCYRVIGDSRMGHRPTAPDLAHAVTTCRDAGLTRLDGRWAG